MKSPRRPRLPLTVISGYLGAGKTTMINRLLAEDHGLRLLVMVNDFGAINIDAALLETATDDTLTLSNGCVCCTMGADLFMAIGDVLDRDPRPDHVIIEASGIADPARIANVAHAEPDLIYGGIVTLVDGLTCGALSKDPLIGPQVIQQVRAADLVAITKLPDPDPALVLNLGVRSGSQVVDLASVSVLAPMLFGLTPGPVPDLPAAPRHAAYVSWHDQTARPMSRDALGALLAARPEELLRFKGFVPSPTGAAWEVQCVGPSVSIKALSAPCDPQVVGIGLKGRITAEDIAAWWLG